MILNLLFLSLIQEEKTFHAIVPSIEQNAFCSISFF
ncbi:hypothetical protein NEOC65_000892 [Neochlamydia sp. AcF65]|nr:hypothetical protein [Neochlamydia sp. AcF65]MBS4171564.1 hypothetical protein [Neochlamydia sp. AcF95]